MVLHKVLVHQDPDLHELSNISSQKWYPFGKKIIFMLGNENICNNSTLTKERSEHYKCIDGHLRVLKNKVRLVSHLMRPDEKVKRRKNLIDKPGTGDSNKIKRTGKKVEDCLPFVLVGHVLP